MDDINFIVVKVNGVDVSRLPKDEVVQMFLATDDTFLVEMRRQFLSTSINKNSKNVSSISKTSTAVHDNIVNKKFKELEITASTDSSNSHEEIYLSANTNTPSLEKLLDVQDISLSTKEALSCDKLVLTVKSSLTHSAMQTCTSSQIDKSYFVYQSAKENAERLIEQEHNLFEQCLAPEIDVEEITLRKSDSNERLGLIVCYSSCNHNGNSDGIELMDENEGCTGVYISGIQPDSVAGRDGRLRQGDQILQINGKYIKNKEETELLIAENNNAVTLLISRYIYTDEDDFNDPLVAELEDDEDDEDDYYDDRNLGYANCFLSNNCLNVVEDLDKVFLAQALHTENNKILENTLTSTTIANKSHCSTTNKSCNSLENNTNNDVKKKNQKDTELGLAEVQKIPTNCKALKQELPIKKDNRLLKTGSMLCPSPSSNIDYETEHIYETIPEDSESEPFYCSPYESTNYVTAVGSCSSTTSDALQLQQKQRVVQWLGIRSGPPNSARNITEYSASKQSSRFGISCGRSLHTCLIPRNKNGITHSTLTCITNGSSSSSGGCSGTMLGNNVTSNLQNEEHDNSSSAYNTGGSNNSTTPLIVMQNHHYDANFCEEDEQFLLALTRSNKTQQILTSKDKVTSPKKSEATLNKSSHLSGSQATKSFRSNSDVQTTEEMSLTPLDHPSKTVYTNESNQYQTMILQQYLYSKAVSNQSQQLYQHLAHKNMHQQQPQLHCPQFTAPNLSQYHFVSSQEVSASTQPFTSTANTSNTVLVPVQNEEAMVWKVKRRPDGTRYIVRRPARNQCLLRERSIRINTNRLRHNKLTATTEEDTISEVKTGRYWSKEERKKHFERARERRQQQQQHGESVAGSATMRVNDRISFKTQLQKRERSMRQQDNLQSNKLSQHQEQPQSIGISQLNTGTPIEQHYQLQFNSTKKHQQLLNPNCNTNILLSDTANVSFSQCKNMNTCEMYSNLDLNVRCSPIDSKIIKPRGTSNADTVITSSGINTAFRNTCENMLHDPLVSVTGSTDGTTVFTHTSSFSSADNENKIQNVLSVTLI